MHRLDEKTADYEAQAVEAREAISRSKRVCDEVRFYTKGEVYRLQGEIPSRMVPFRTPSDLTA